MAHRIYRVSEEFNFVNCCKLLCRKKCNQEASSWLVLGSRNMESPYNEQNSWVTNEFVNPTTKNLNVNRVFINYKKNWPIEQLSCQSQRHEQMKRSLNIKIEKN